MSSRLVRTPSGRVCAVEITTPLPGLTVGYRFTVLGTEVHRSSFRFTGEPTGRPPLPEETVRAARAARVGVGVERAARTWTDADRARARELQAEGLSWSKIAEQVCGDKRYKPTIGSWLRAA